MLYLELNKMMEDRGIENPNQFLVKAGFTYYAASRLLHTRKTTINLNHLERLCFALHCSIEDLIVWEPKEMVNATKHPLYKLKARQRKGNISTGLKYLPPEKVEELRNYIQQLQNPSS